MNWRIFYLFVIVINTSVSKNLHHELPCAFLKSVNITGGATQLDDSIIFENIRFTQYANITYTFENGKKRHEKSPYTRGCIPEDKAFIRLYCDFDVNPQDCPSYQNVRNLQHAVNFGESNQTILTLDQQFGYIFDQPCPPPYAFYTNYIILHTGDVLDEDDDEYANTQYTLEFSRNNKTNEIETKLRVCGSYVIQQPIQVAMIFSRFEPAVTIITMIISVILLTLTFILYLYLPDLDHFYGKMLLCYLSGPAIAFFFIVLVRSASISSSLIYNTIGYIVYFSFTSSFAWVSVISFDLWKSFRTSKMLTVFSERKMLLLYMLYAWGLAFFLTLLFHISSSSNSSSTPEQSNVTLSTCFLDVNSRVDCLIYYTPIWIIIAVSQIFFTLTAIKVYSLCGGDEDSSLRLKLNRQKSHINDGDNFSLHLRLHLATCLAWILKALILKYTGLGGLGFYAYISFDLQGLVIFVIFALNRHVLHLIGKRWNHFLDQRETTKRQRTMSIRSQTSYEAIKPHADTSRQRTTSVRSQTSYEPLKTYDDCPWIFDPACENTRL